ncbi:RNA pyrophosphohydrolase [Candidatus Fokinia solitaria]|uniref:RNA pyrophosphohydrolase n=1 Tax=Candidatus Fokinia solitaria TaxID=1802984 RepID=A0A2U8BTH2_9RICK|nr:RNA pyrophosphohydrolase [Candidatus Fokinia solitaria]AWD33520.1 RNA pyrophosphohydrolase [Candidatus Fokinia solitaria]
MYRLGVGAIIVKSNIGVWQGKRIDNINGWQLPQGGIEENENPEEAVLREVYEETGIKNVEMIGNNDVWYQYDFPKEVREKVWNGCYVGQKQRWFVLRFYGTDEEIDILKEPVEFSAWRWCSVKSVIEDVVSFKRCAYEKFIRDYNHVISDIINITVSE